MKVGQSARAVLFLPLLVLAHNTAEAEDVADFYRGKQIRIVIGSDVGGGYDIYARTVGRHLGKHIPGNPTIVPQNMNGAGSRIAANWVYNIGAKDGTIIGQVSQGTPLDQARKQEGVQFDAAKMQWIGNPVVDNLNTTSWRESGLATIDDVRTKGGLVCGGSGASTPGQVYPLVLNRLLGTTIRTISGYPGTGTVNLAMERGEINCVAGYAWSSLTSQVPQWLDQHKLNLLVQWGPRKDPAAEKYQGRDVPLILNFARDSLERRALELIVSGVSVGRPFFVAPDVPAERVTALRRAFDATMNDPEFRADAARQSVNIAPITGEELQKIASDVAYAPPDVLRQADALMAPTDK